MAARRRRVLALVPDVVGLQEVVRCRAPSRPGRDARRGARHQVLLRGGDAVGRRRGAGDFVAPSNRRRARMHELPHAVPTERRLVIGVTSRRPTDRQVYTTHLDYRLTDGGKREDQIVALDEHIAARRRSCRRSCAATSTPRPTATRFAFCAGCTRRRAAHVLAGRVGAAARARRRLHLGARQSVHGAAALARARSAPRLHLREPDEARRARRRSRLPHRARSRRGGRRAAVGSLRAVRRGPARRRSKRKPRS